MRRIIFELCLLIAMLLVAGTGMILAFNMGRTQGYLNGQSDGIHSGYKAGRHDGYTIGYSKGQSDQSSIDSTMYQNGYTDGYTDGQQTFSDFYDYLTNSCGKDINGYYQVVIYHSSTNGAWRYTCIA